jgi:hypothetical protein
MTPLAYYVISVLTSKARPGASLSFLSVGVRRALALAVRFLSVALSELYT